MWRGGGVGSSVRRARGRVGGGGLIERGGRLEVVGEAVGSTSCVVVVVCCRGGGGGARGRES